MKLSGSDDVNVEFLTLDAEESPIPDTVLDSEWTGMSSARQSGEKLMTNVQDFVVCSKANRLLVKIPTQYQSQEKQSYLILEMLMNDDEEPSKMMSGIHLPLGLTASRLNKKRTSFEPTAEHFKLLQECCPSKTQKGAKNESGTKPPSAAAKAKRKNPGSTPTKEVATPVAGSKKSRQAAAKEAALAKDNDEGSNSVDQDDKTD